MVQLIRIPASLLVLLGALACGKPDSVELGGAVGTRGAPRDSAAVARLVLPRNREVDHA